MNKEIWDAKTKEEKITSVKKAQRLIVERNAANVEIDDSYYLYTDEFFSEHISYFQ